MMGQTNSHDFGSLTESQPDDDNHDDDDEGDSVTTIIEDDKDDRSILCITKAALS